MEMVYSTALFTKSTVEKITHQYVHILEQILDSGNCDIKLKEIMIPHDLVTAQLRISAQDQSEFEF